MSLLTPKRGRYDSHYTSSVRDVHLVRSCDGGAYNVIISKI